MPKERKKVLCMDAQRHAEYYGMQQTFDELYAKSKAGEVFNGLMELVLSPDNIMLAYRNIKTNTGSYTAGTDKQNIGDIGRLPPAEVIGKVRKIVTGSEHGYLHVREDIDEKVKEARQIMTKVAVDMIGFYFNVDVSECSNNNENTPFADAGEDEIVSIPKGEYEQMIDDLLTMSEIIQCVADMRTQDVKAIREFGKFVPAFAAFEKNRLSLYREAAKEAEEIFDRWADEIDDLDEDFMEDEDYEPDEYYSD